MKRRSVVSWLQGFAGRGITFAVRNGRLRCHPAKGYQQLTDAELLFLRHNRDAIKAALRAGFHVQAVTPTTSESVAPTVMLAPEPERCPHCYQAPCIGETSEHYDALHPLTDRQRFERRMAQAEKDNRELELRSRYRLPSPTWE